MALCLTNSSCGILHLEYFNLQVKTCYQNEPSVIPNLVASTDEIPWSLEDFCKYVENNPCNTLCYNYHIINHHLVSNRIYMYWSFTGFLSDVKLYGALIAKYESKNFQQIEITIMSFKLDWWPTLNKGNASTSDIL